MDNFYSLDTQTKTRPPVPDTEGRDITGRCKQSQPLTHLLVEDPEPLVPYSRDLCHGLEGLHDPVHVGND